MIPTAMEGLTGMGLQGVVALTEPGNFMDALPDPMKLDLYQIAFVIVLVTVLYLFLKFAFFNPVTQVMDARDADIAAGSAAKADAASRVEQRQAEYAARLRDLRGKAFEHRKALAAAASQEKASLLEQARQQASETRLAAIRELKEEKDSARIELMTQIEALSESMVQHLLKQA